MIHRLRTHGRSATALVALAAWASASITAHGQGPSLTLRDAVVRAIDHYPSVRAAGAQTATAAANAALARDAYLPRADAVWQVNRATRNNISGLLFPQPILSSISGPVSPESGESIWNHALGVLVAWEPIDFGYRSGMVRAADAARTAAGAEESLVKLQVGAAAADAFLTVLAADEAVRAARAGVDRARAIFDIVNARAQAGLRPGADAARANAEVAAAESSLARAEQGSAIARVELQRWTAASDPIVVTPEPFLQLPADTGTAPPAQHPRVQAAEARVAAARASEAAASRAHVPHVVLEATTYARGSGAAASGAIGDSNGFSLTARNWAVGLNVTFGILDGPVAHQRRALEIAREEDATARYDQARQDLAGDLARAEATLAAARRIAALAPIQLDAAREAEEQARARFDSGLGTMADVADTLRLLTDAETARSLATLAVWRARLGVAVAMGDLSPMLALSGTGGGRP